ncbi:inositol polyphosphate 5-phosphatase E-like [Actinia tenebrosa]|uniref:Inositol polyphosphate 5-phosphatase E-like n=1 Tax=Actinia tenebrosa TaxID=6105 RepID=A0A6P8IPT9_ACTTE|nr:inositol polyphosphate 5-phosphatase E-like [Actinia tenebrosa]
MSDGAGNYSFYNHNLRTTHRPTIQPNRLGIRRQSSENALNNEIKGLSIISPSVSKTEQFVGEPFVTGFVPHPPSSPLKEGQSRRSTPIRFRGQKRLRSESPRTSGSEDERISRKHMFNSRVSPLSTPPRRSSDGSIDTSRSDLQRGRNIKLEPLIQSNKDLVNSFKNYQQNVKSETKRSDISRSNPSILKPLKVVHDFKENKEGNSEMQLETRTEFKDNDNNAVILENNKKDDDGDDELSSSGDSFTNVSGDDDDDSTLSSSSASDQEVKERSERIAKELLTRRYPDATLPSIPKNFTLNSTGTYENMSSIMSATYESVPEFQNHLKSYLRRDLDSATDHRYASDSNISRKEGSNFSYASQSSFLPRVAAQKVRLRNMNFLQEEMLNYFPDRKVGVFVATWNMHEEKEIPGYLDDFLLPENVDFLQDIYVIGLQECTPLRKEWEIRLQETLGPSHVLMYSSSFGVLHMAVYVRREIVWFCSAVNQDTVATRVGHMIKTKGGLAFSFNLFGTSFLFINSHLTSGEGKSKDRVNDYNVICKSLNLQSVEKPWTDNRPDVTDRFDRVFWLGDFNFRVDLPREKVDELLVQYQEQNDNEFKELLAQDQMTKLMEKDEVFHGFTEPDIRFPPTYKYDLNSDTYDSSSKLRIPSWTDRVLYKSAEGNTITNVCYKACSSVRMSDHRPVYGIYQVTLKPCKQSIPLTGGQFVRDVYIEANRRRNTASNRSQKDSSVCTIL